MTTQELMKVELSSDCECRFCADCGLVQEDVACAECDKETSFIDYCDGDCYLYKVEALEEWLIPQFMTANGDPSYLRLEGRRMGWQALSGYKVIEATYTALRDSLIFSGQWRLVFTLSGKDLTITRYSHDEPMGATFTLTPATEEEHNA